MQIIIEAAGTNGMYDSVALDNIVLIDDYCPRSKGKIAFLVYYQQIYVY